MGSCPADRYQKNGYFYLWDWWQGPEALAGPFFVGPCTTATLKVVVEGLGLFPYLDNE